MADGENVTVQGSKSNTYVLKRRGDVYSWCVRHTDDWEQARHCDCVHVGVNMHSIIHIKRQPR
jgi:hypothetical protein